MWVCICEWIEIVTNLILFKVIRKYCNSSANRNMIKIQLVTVDIVERFWLPSSETNCYHKFSHGIHLGDKST